MPDSDGLDGQRSLIAGILWTAFGPTGTWAFTYLTAAMAIALVTFMVTVRRRRVGSSE